MQVFGTIAQFTYFRSYGLSVKVNFLTFGVAFQKWPFIPHFIANISWHASVTQQCLFHKHVLCKYWLNGSKVTNLKNDFWKKLSYTYIYVLDLDTYTIRPEVGKLRYSSENLHGNLELISDLGNIQFSYVPLSRSAVEAKVLKHPVYLWNINLVCLFVYMCLPTFFSTKSPRVMTFWPQASFCTT